MFASPEQTSCLSDPSAVWTSFSLLQAPLESAPEASADPPLTFFTPEVSLLLFSVKFGLGIHSELDVRGASEIRRWSRLVKCCV